MNNIKGIATRALHKLSEDIYSSGSRFIYELIQNADDNSYIDGETPEIQFDINKEYVFTENNEVFYHFNLFILIAREACQVMIYSLCVMLINRLSGTKIV
jgi:hypothetical protein